MDDRTKQAICHRYHLGDLLACEQLGGTRNRNYLFRTSSGKWFVRQRYAGYCHPARIAFDNLVLSFLRTYRVPVVPPREMVPGLRHWEDGRHVWQVFPFVEGGHLREGSLEDMRALGQGLGRLHRVGARFPIKYNKLGPRGETDPLVILNHADDIEKESPDSAQPLGLYREWVVAAQKDMPHSLYLSLPHTLVHGDVQPANVLVHKGRLAAFVDLDWCAWRPRIYDLAFATLFCCATHDTPIQGEDVWSLTQPPRTEPGLVEAFLESYQSETEPLAKEETKALRGQIILTWCHCRVAGALKVPKDKRAEFLSREPAGLDRFMPAFLRQLSRMTKNVVSIKGPA